jgi:hypothetical protein
MGCSTTREKIEDKMMVYKLERMEIQMEKEKELKKLAEIEGHTVERHQIPDYIDPDFARERKLHEKDKDKEKENEKGKNKKKKDKDSKTDGESSSQKKKKKKKN